MKILISEMHLMLFFLVTVTQISLNSICPWVIFIIKPQMYYNKANCNIYNPELMTMSQFISFLGLKSTEIQCDIKMKIFLFIWVENHLSVSYTILKCFLCILWFLTGCKLEKLGIHMVCSYSLNFSIFLCIISMFVIF